MTNEHRPIRVLVTGAAGFIGSHVVERLLEDGFSVLGVDNFDPFYSRAIKETNLENARRHPQFEFREGDLRDPAFLKGVFEDGRPEAVVHLAAKAGVRPSIKEPEAYYETNVMGTMHLLKAMSKSGVRSLVFGSSSSVYGSRDDDLPFCEDDDADQPISPYAATKRTGELMCHTSYRLEGLSCCCLRFFTVYGPRQRPDLAIHKFTRALASGEPVSIYGDGGALRDYTYVADTVEGVRRALSKVMDLEKGALFEIVNVGAGRTISVNELVHLLVGTLGVEPSIKRLPVQPGDVPRTWADISHARDLLGYEPQVPIEEGLRRFVAWFREVNQPG